MPTMDELEGLCTSLRSNGATSRRKAMKEVLELVEKESNRASLAVMTAGKTSMWVRLVKNAKLAVDMEIAAAFKKDRVPRKEEAEFLWKLVRLADERSRQLKPVVADLLRHVVNVLVDDVSREIYAQDYTQILCRLLESPEYCEEIPPKLFENTMHLLLTVLGQGQDGTDDPRGVAGYARSLQLLLAGYGKDIHEFLDPLIEFFSWWCVRLDRSCERGTGAQPLSSLFEGLKTLLRLYGTTCAPMLRRHGRGILDFVLRRFSLAQRAQREFILEYLRLHLRIAGMTRGGCEAGEQDPIFDAVPNLYRLKIRCGS
ncbi:unnamed protein product [Discosporangium mesarthrocarpum]